MELTQAIYGSTEFFAISFTLFVLFTSVHWSFSDGRVKALRNKKENQQYVKEQTNKLNKITDTLVWQQHRLTFINERNQKQKIVAHEINVRNKLNALKKQAKPDDLRIESLTITSLQEQMLCEEEIEQLKKQYEKEKLENDYCIKKAELGTQLTQEWIAKNIDSITIDYNEIDVHFVENGEEKESQQKDKVSKKGKYLKDNGLTRTGFFVLSFALSAIGADAIAEGGTKEAWAIFAFRMALVTYNLIMGINYGDKFYDEYDLHNINARVSISYEFQDWALNKGYMTIKKTSLTNKGL